MLVAVEAVEGMDKNNILQLSAALQKTSDHPLAHAV